MYSNIMLIFLIFKGILEVDQLGFTCLMTSEGSRCEKLTKSNDIETSSYKVGVKPNENYEEPTSSQQAMPLVPLDYEEDIPFLVRLASLMRNFFESITCLF